MREEVYLKTTYVFDSNRKTLITGPYEDKELLEKWVERSTKENSELILAWCLCNKEGEGL